MAKDDIKCFLVSLPEILIINSHGASLEKVIITEKFYENLMKSEHREVKQYSAIVALYENKVLFKRDCCFIIQENGDVCIAEETVVTKSATSITKASNSVKRFSEEIKEIQLQYDENLFEKELLSSFKQRLELGFEDIRAKLKIIDSFSHTLFKCTCE